MTRKHKDLCKNSRICVKTQSFRGSEPLIASKKSVNKKKPVLVGKKLNLRFLSFLWNEKRRRVLILDGIITCGIIQLGTVVCNLGQNNTYMLQISKK